MNAQQLIIGHLLPIGAAIAVLWLAYRLLFINSNRLRFNRLFLLTAMLFSLVLPLLGLWVGTEAPQMVSLKQNLLGGTMLGEIVVTPDGQTALPEAEIVANTTVRPQISVWQVLAVIYLIGVGVAALLLLIKLGKLAALVIRSPKEKREGYTAVFTGKEQGSFSFFRYAFFPNENVAPDIVRHEMSHIGHRHSWDILFVEVMMVLQWFNPFIYLYKKELQSLHEYQADRDVVATGVDKRNYMMLILQQCTAVDFSGIGNNFSLILTKKRIKMITKNEKAKGLWWRLLATLPVLAILLIANTKVTAQDASSKLSNKAEKKPITVEMGCFEIFDDDGAPIRLTDTTIYAEDGSYIKMESSDGFDPMTGEPCKKLTVTSFGADGKPANNFFITEEEKHGDTTRYSIEPFTISGSLFETLLDVATSDEDKKFQTIKEDVYQTLKNKSVGDSIYQIVEQMPKFPGGESALMEYVSKNVAYPEEAKEKEIQGRVFIGFVVEKDGSIGEVKVLRGIGGGCDEEAVRVIKGMPKWKPGMQKGKPVRVSYQIPIMFKLGQTNDEYKTTVKTVIAGDDEHSWKTSTATIPDNPAKEKMQPDKNGVYQIVEEMPQFPGGETKLMEYIAKNLTYPQEARDKGIDGRVFIGMVIEKDGSVSNVKVLRGIGSGCDEEAVRVIKSMPKWKPGMMKGEPVPVSYQIPINFKLSEKQPKKK
ncbi:MAG: TonB family protein [Bacteroidales bacterium]|nr:TonB family protein [Bacteroidales bacterium]